MAELPVPSRVFTPRRDGKRQVLLHRSIATLSEDKVQIRSARATVWLPLLGLCFAAGVIALIAAGDGSAPLWLLVGALLILLFLVPICVMGLVSAVAGADVIVDRAKNSAMWQQGYLGMGIGTKELVPFQKVDYLEITIEGGETDRWHDQADDLRQFALTIVKKNGKRVKVAQVPVPAYGQEDGMDRTLAVGNAIAALVGVEVRIPEGWELVEVDADTLEPVAVAPAPAAAAPGPTRPKPRKRR